jgi:hypothetical protein
VIPSPCENQFRIQEGRAIKEDQRFIRVAIGHCGSRHGVYKYNLLEATCRSARRYQLARLKSPAPSHAAY